jgi:DNA-binding transcriptional LysR family regulator
MVGNHVQELEERLGARLLNRTTREVSLTEIGREYYERSAQILAYLDEPTAPPASCKRPHGGGFALIAIRPSLGSSRRP